MKTINILFSGLSLSLQGILISCSFLGLLLIDTSLEYAYYVHYLLIIGVLLLQLFDSCIRKPRVGQDGGYYIYYLSIMLSYGIVLFILSGPISIPNLDWKISFYLSLLFHVTVPLVGSIFYFIESLTNHLNTNEDLL